VEVSLSTAGYDVIVVGAGPAGSLAAITLARAGARVGLVDKAKPGRDKACGDLIGPRGVRVLDELGLGVPGARTVGDMIVVGPTGRRVLLPARPGRTYPGHAVVVPRARFDAHLHTAALDAGAIDIPARVASVDDGRVAVDGGRVLLADVVIGADGATSVTARSAGLVVAERVLWGFAIRGYVPAEVTLPVIAFWNDRPHRGFPGYGWLFPGPDGANLGLGLGLGNSRRDAHRAQQQLDAFRIHLTRIGLLGATRELPAQQLGGWLKMGLIGTRPASGKVLLVGDAAGLVNPLQGEGIAQALASGQAAARAVLTQPGDAAATYRRWVEATYGGWASVTSPAHASLVGHPRRIAGLSATLTAPIVGQAIASTWAIYWNDLTDGARATPAVTAAKAVHGLGRIATTRSRVRRALRHDLGDDSWGAALIEDDRTSPSKGASSKTWPMSILTEPIHTLHGDETSLAAFDGQSILAVNVASKCGLTPQYTGLEALQQTYAGRGFTVVGFPCNQFGGQEPGTAEEIETFCSTNYGVTFPLMEKIDVNGDGRHPIYTELTAVADAEGHSGDIRWNFEKFLIAADGSITRFAPTVTPEDPALVQAIEASLPS
jgi:geranylgeranyl reductase family protein